MPSNRPFTTVAGYELIEELAASQTAAVWRGRDPRSRRAVAVKRLHPRLLADLAARERLAAEADAVSRLEHPNIVPLLDARFADDEVALVFPLIDGQPLAQRLADDGPLSAPEAARVATDVAAALAHAHAAGIAHRDIKPGNILIGRDGRAHVVDFGIAATPERAATPSAARPKMVLGTLPYMAPEQLRGGPANPAGDVFALSLVLYEMLSGRRPYEALSPESLAEEHGRQPASIEGVPPALMALILAGLDPDPSARPSAAELELRLRGWLAALPNQPTIAIAAVPLAQPTAGFALPRAPFVAALVLLLAAAVTGAFFLGFDASTPPDPAATDAPAGVAGDETAPPPTQAAPTPDQPAAQPVSQPVTEQKGPPAKSNAGKSDKKDKDKGKGKGKGKGDDDDD